MSGQPQLSGTVTDLCSPGGQKCGTLLLFHNCLHSCAQVSRACGGWAAHRRACSGSGPRRRRGSPSLETYVHHTTNSQWVRVQNAEVMDLIPALRSHLPLGSLSVPVPPPASYPLPPDSFTKPHWCSHCDICEARSPHNKNTLGKCLGSNVCLNWPDESHLDWVCAILLATKYSHRRGCGATS